MGGGVGGVGWGGGVVRVRKKAEGLLVKDVHVKSVNLKLTQKAIDPLRREGANLALG